MDAYFFFLFFSFSFFFSFFFFFFSSFYSKGNAWTKPDQRPSTSQTSHSKNGSKRVQIMDGENDNDEDDDEDDEDDDKWNISRTLIGNVLCSCIVMNKEIITGNSNGELIMWHPMYGDPVGRREQAHQGEVWCVASSGEMIVSGGEDGFVRIWDIEMNCIGCRSFPITDMSTGSPVLIYWGIRSLSCVTLRSSSLRVALCTEDNRMFTFALPGAGHKGTTRLVQEAHHSRELCAMAPHPKDSDLFVTGGDDMTLRIWRISSLSVIVRRQLPSMTRAVCWSPDGTLIAAGMGGGSSNAEERRLDGSWVVFRSDDLRVVHHGRDATQYITVIRFSPNGNYLAVGSLDTTISVYDVIRGYVKHSVCNDFNGFVSQLDWSFDSKFLRTNSGFFELSFYDVVGGTDFEDGEDALTLEPKEVRDIVWSTSTCTLSWSNLGVHPTDRQQVQVNTVDVAMNKCQDLIQNESGLIATGNDDGIIKIFRYPAPNRNAKGIDLIGHGPHISVVRWTSDETALISIGASDRSIMLWDIN